MRDQLLSAGNAPQHAAGVIREETLRGDFVAMLGTLLLHAGETRTDFHAFNGVNAHQRVGQVRIQAIEDRLAQARGHAAGMHRDPRPDGVALLNQGLHIGLHLRHLVDIRAEERVLPHLRPIQLLSLDRPQLRQVSAHLDSVLLLQPLLGDGTCGDAHGGLARG